jgi:hypothetical protein
MKSIFQKVAINCYRNEFNITILGPFDETISIFWDEEDGLYFSRSTKEDEFRDILKTAYANCTNKNEAKQIKCLSEKLFPKFDKLDKKAVSCSQNLDLVVGNLNFIIFLITSLLEVEYNPKLFMRR